LPPTHLLGPLHSVARSASGIGVATSPAGSVAAAVSNVVTAAASGSRDTGSARCSVTRRPARREWSRRGRLVHTEPRVPCQRLHRRTVRAELVRRATPLGEITQRPVDSSYLQAPSATSEPPDPLIGVLQQIPSVRQRNSQLAHSQCIRNWPRATFKAKSQVVLSKLCMAADSGCANKVVECLGRDPADKVDPRNAADPPRRRSDLGVGMLKYRRRETRINAYSLIVMRNGAESPGTSLVASSIQVRCRTKAYGRCGRSTGMTILRTRWSWVRAPPALRQRLTFKIRFS
jgi:hypothetical protein